MDNFDTYTYARTLRFFEAYYPYDIEDIHYADVLLSMNQSSTIDELILLRERLKKKVDKISYYNADKLPKDIIDEISKSNSYRSNLSYNMIQENLRFDINACYDENIFRLFNEKKLISPEVCGEFFINLTYCPANTKYKELIIREAQANANIDVSELLETIAKRYKDFRDNWMKYKGFKEGMNGYKAAKMVVEDDLEYLKKYKWRLLPEEKALYNEIDREERKKKEELALILKEKREEELRKHEERLKYLKIEIEKRKESENRRLEEENKKKRKKTIIKIILGVILYIGIIVLICEYVPRVVMNWILAIIVYLAIMKTILGKM